MGCGFHEFQEWEQAVSVCPKHKLAPLKIRVPLFWASLNMLPINWGEIIPLSVSFYGGGRPVFPFLFIICFLILFAMFRYISEWIVWQKKEYKFPIVKQLVWMWQQCGLLHFAYRAIGVECSTFPVWWNNELGIQTVTDLLTWIFTDLMSYCRTVVNIHVCESLKEQFFASLFRQWLGKVMK